MSSPVSADSAFADRPRPRGTWLSLRGLGLSLVALAALPVLLAAGTLLLGDGQMGGGAVLAVLGLFSVLLTLLAWAGLRWIVRPLHHLASALHHIEMGSYRPWMQPRPGPLRELQVLHRGLVSLWEGLEEQRSTRDAALARLDEELAQRRAMAQELEQRERGWRELFEAHPQMMWICEPVTQRFLAVNHAALAHYGFARDEFLAMSLADLLPAGEPDAGVGRQPAEARGRLARHVTRSGRGILVEMVRHPVRFQEQRARLCMVTDVTARLAGESRLRAALDDAHRRAAELSQEVAQAAALREGVARLLDTRVLPHLPAGAADGAEQVLRRMQRLVALERAEPESRLVDLSSLASHAIHLLRLSAPQRRVHVEIEPGLAASTDAELARVVVQELLGNAWRFTAGRTHAWIRMGQLDGCSEDLATYYVSDNGAGFDEDEAQPRIYAPFETLPEHATLAGSGLGLALAATALRRLGGRVWAQSRAGQGATLLFTLGPQAPAGALVSEVVIEPALADE